MKKTSKVLIAGTNKQLQQRLIESIRQLDFYPVVVKQSMLLRKLVTNYDGDIKAVILTSDPEVFEGFELMNWVKSMCPKIISLAMQSNEERNAFHESIGVRILQHDFTQKDLVSFLEIPLRRKSTLQRIWRRIQRTKTKRCNA